MSVIEKKSRRTLTIEPSSSQGKESANKEDKTPTRQRLVYVAARAYANLDDYDAERRDLGDYFTRLVKGYIKGKKMDEEEEDGVFRRLWKDVTPWPVEFVPLGHPDVLNLDLATLFATTTSAEQFVLAFRSATLQRQLARKSGPGLVHGWIFNFDKYAEYQELGEGERLHDSLKLLHAIVRGEKATWASMHAIYYWEFDSIGRLIRACAAGHTTGVAAMMQFPNQRMISEILRLAKEKPDTTDWKDLSNRWTEDVLEPLSMLTSPPNADTQKRMLDTLDLVLGKKDGSIVASDMKRCLLPPGHREPLQPNDAHLVMLPHDRRLLVFGLLWKMVEAATPWNQRYWPVARWPLDYTARWSLINQTRIFDIHFTHQEEQLVTDSDTAIYEISTRSAQELVSQIAEVSPQMRKDRLLGGSLLTYTSIKGGGEMRAVHPISKLTGRGRFWPDSKSGGNKTPGTAQIVTSFLGKASDQELHNMVSRFEEEEEVTKRQRDYNTDTVGSYRPFLSTTSTSTAMMSAGARLQTTPRKKLLLLSRR